MFEVSPQLLDRFRIFLNGKHPASPGQERCLHRDRASSRPHVIDTKCGLDVQPGHRHRPDLLLGHGDWLALVAAQKFRVVQPDGRITPGRGGGGGDEHRRQRVKLPPGQLLRRAVGELFLRVGEVFPHPDLRFSQAPKPSRQRASQT